MKICSGGIEIELRHSGKYKESNVCRELDAWTLKPRISKQKKLFEEYNLLYLLDFYNQFVILKLGVILLKWETKIVGKRILTILPVIAFAIAQIAMGRVSTRVYLADGNTPLELTDPNIPFLYRDIMVETKLTIVVSSDTGGYWEGDLVIAGEDGNYGLLSARDYNETTFDWAGSHLPAAGYMARVWDLPEPGVQRLNLIGHRAAVAGDWFIIDYTAISVGVCNVALYDHAVSWVEPIYHLMFSHVPTRDFNSDTKVDFADFAVFASHWQLTNCNDPNWCEGTDLNTDSKVDGDDLQLFAKYWLESTQ